MKNTEPVLDAYVDWLRSGVSSEVLDQGVTELTTPFLDRHNDHLQIYAELRSPDLILLTDDGYIIAELKASGVEQHGKRRKEILHSLLSGHGVHLIDRELQIEATSENLGRKVHSLVQAMLSLDDMFVLAQPSVQTIFHEDVAKYLDDSDIRYAPGAKFAGRSGLDHLVDFVIPKSKNAPERFLQVLSSPRRDRVESVLFTANDTRATRHRPVDFYVLVNDKSKDVSTDVLRAFSEYEVKARTWSERDDLLGELAA